ncbi:MAG: hypothetical protein LBV54_08870 [Puniceicoccales bacterium]|jgi:hypothetical protein|nr:hypothetical protein [Puniceicoccales bacterium]
MSDNAEQADLPPVPEEVALPDATGAPGGEYLESGPALQEGQFPPPEGGFYQELEQPLEALPMPPPKEVTRWQRFWRKFGGDGFLVSLGVHILLVIIALTWVVSQIVISKPEPTTFTTGSGGGDKGEKVTRNPNKNKAKNARNMVKSMPKLAAKTSNSAVSLPELPSMNFSALESGALAGASSKGLGGGDGGGIGVGSGPGFGGRGMVSLFGAKFRQPNRLEATLYDLKRDKNGKGLYAYGNQGARINEMKVAFTGFVATGLRKSFFDGKYAAAPDKLYASSLFIPPVNASEATKAFNCEDKIQAPGWLGYYEGWITPPESGMYRFAGMGDDGLLVAIQGQVKFWGPWTQGGMQTWVKPQKDWEPKSAYLANGSLPNLGSNGRYYGSWFDMTKGRTYRIQIVIAEGYGGLFSAGLLIQQKSKLPDASPAMEVPLPVFKLAPLLPEELALIKGAHMVWTHEGPNFGCGINGVGMPTGSSAR